MKQIRMLPMSESKFDSKFVVRKGHFHTADKNRYVLTGWFDGMDTAQDAPQESFEAFLIESKSRLKLQHETLVFEDESVRQKYAKFDQNVTREYVIIISLPPELSGSQKQFCSQKLSVCLSDGTCIYERRVSQLLKLQNQLECRITDIQITGADCVLTGWAVCEKQIEARVFDHASNRIACEISHFPRPDVLLEYRESDRLLDCGFSIHVPMQGRKKMVLLLTDGESSMRFPFSAVDKRRMMLYLKKAHYFMKRNGMKKTCKRAVNEAYELIGDTGNYIKWRKKNMPSARELAKQRQQMRENVFSPVIYVVTPYRASAHLRETAVSLRDQTYENWKWMILCSAAEREQLKEQLKIELKGLVPAGRVMLAAAETPASAYERVVRHLQSMNRPPQENQKLQNNTWITMLEPGDTLDADAFYGCMKLAQKDPAMELCYTDEDKIAKDGKTYSEPNFKSDFNIDMLRAVNYFGHMVLLRGSLICRTAPMNPETYGECADYDYYLRTAEEAAGIGHLRRAVYHVRSQNAPSSAKAEKTEKTAIMALNAHYKRLGIPAEAAGSDIPGIYRTKYHWKEMPKVSVLIPNMDHLDDLDTCVQSVLKLCTYPNYEIVIIENNSTQKRTFAYYEKIQKQDSRVRVITWKDSFNFSKIMNFGVENADGDYVLLLNNDTEVITPDFMEEMLGYCMRTDVGVCGARLFYFDDTIQHAGVIIGLGGICGEGFQRFPKENSGYQNRICCPQDYSAVTAACLMAEKSVYKAVGGMDEEFQVAYNDIDFCLKVRASGKLVVYNPFAMLYHYEYKSRGTENTAAKLARYNREVELFTTRWADIISAGDPYYNPNLTKRYQDFSLRRIELL